MDKLMFALAYTANVIKAPRKDEKGATAVEYGLLVALIAAVIIAAVVILGERVNLGFETVNDELPAGGGDAAG